MKELTGKTVLITGGTGSFGQKVLRYLLETTNAKEFRVFSRDECKQELMRIEINNSEASTYHPANFPRLEQD